jgi:hypothetical protein
MIENVGTDQRVRRVAQHPQRVLAAMHGRSFAIADQAFFRRHPHEGGAAARRIAGIPGHLEGIDGLDDRRF